MSPTAKESTRSHPFVYALGVSYHLGIFTALATLLWVVIAGPARVAPVAVVRAIIVMPVVAGAPGPSIYVLGVYAMAVAYGLYYVVSRPTYSATWIYGIVFCFFYLVFLLWQTYYAILTARTSSWGTRPATAGQTAQPAEPALS